MIEIITKDGISLDLSPDAEFEIEIENPMLDDSHIPVPFSTAISFLPTLTNKKVFGYIGAMMLEPAVTEVEVFFFSGGIPLLEGSLIFDGIEDGMLNYSLVGKDIEKELDKYIHTSKGLTNAIGVKQGSDGIIGEARELIERAQSGDRTLDFGMPLIVCKTHVMKNDTPNTDNTPNVNEIDPKVKFRNYDGDKYLPVPAAPAVRIKAILDSVLPKMDVVLSSQRLYDSLAIVALYLTEESEYGWKKIDNTRTLRFDVASMLPEIKAKDLLINTLKILCASLFRDGSRFVIRQHSDIIGNNYTVDWDDKISDVYSLATEEPRIYSFGYADYDNENDFTPDPDEKISGYLGMRGIVSSSGNDKLIRDIQTNDVFTVDKKRHLADIVFQYLQPEKEEEDSDNMYDASSDFRLVKCIPVNRRTVETFHSGPPSRPTYTDIVSAYRICPRIDFPSLGLERPKEVYIGTLVHNQLTDKGQIPEGSELYEDDFDDYDGIVTDYDFPNRPTGLSITPGDLLNGPHHAFAEWLGKRRQSISAELNLTNADISGFRMWQKVLIRQRPFIVKKLILTFSASSDHIHSRGEFISV